MEYLETFLHTRTIAQCLPDLLRTRRQKTVSVDDELQTKEDTEGVAKRSLSGQGTQAKRAHLCPRSTKYIRPPRAHLQLACSLRSENGR